MSPRLLRKSSVAAVALLVMGAFWAPPFLEGNASGWGDWGWFHHQWEAGRAGYLRHHEIPLYDPYHCGGVSLWGNPQTQVYAPTYLLTGLVFGTMWGHKLYVLLHALLGWIGMYWLARREFRFGTEGAFVAATLWACSGFFAWHGAGGHATYLSFYWAPWLLHFWRRSERDLRYAAGVALLLTLTVAEGGHYPAPYFVLMLVFDLLTRSTGLRNAFYAWRAATLAGLATVLMSAFRIVPIYLTLKDYPRVSPDNDSMSLGEVVTMLTARTRPETWSHAWVWNEYGAFIGWGAVGLAGVGVGVAVTLWVRKRLGHRVRGQHHLAIVASLIFFLLLLQGSRTEFHPWTAIHQLPFYDSLRVPSRFRGLLILYVALACGLAIDQFRELSLRVRWPPAARSLGPALPWLLAVALVADIFVVNLPIVDRWDGPMVGREEPAEQFYLVSSPNYLREYQNYPGRNVGTPLCYDPVPWVRSRRLWTGDVAQVRIEPPSAGEVISWGRTNNRVWTEVLLREPAQVVFNQNYQRDWVGWETPAFENENRLAVRADPAEQPQRVELRLQPRDRPYSLAMSCLGLLAALALSFRVPRRLR